MNPGTMLLVWAFGFWFAIISAEGLWRLTIDPSGLFNATSKEGIQFLALIWLAGLIFLFINYFGSNGKDASSETEEPEEPEEIEEDSDIEKSGQVRIIVESPGSVEAGRTGIEVIETLGDFDSDRIPKPGELLVLNSKEGENEADIVGIVDEIAEAVHVFEDESYWCVWVKLRNEKDYVRLVRRAGWYRGDAYALRSTSPQPVRQDVPANSVHTG